MKIKFNLLKDEPVANVVDYYIDESGDLEPISKGGAKVFSIGCAIVNSKKKTTDNILKLHKNINDSAFFKRHKTDKFFHACSDHSDIYPRYVELLNSLDFRAYVLILNKKTKYFEELIKNKNKSEIYNYLISKLLYDRLLKRKNKVNILNFERQNNKLEKEKSEKENIVLSINNELKNKALIDSDLNYEINIKTKDDELLTIVDYVIHIVSRLYEGKKEIVYPFMKKNFRLIEPKIALILDLANRVYYKPRTNKINIDNFFIKR